ncbi:MAG: tetratricopeptide repeat protein [Deltaproteobacteria bacterium]|jgi:hypothetical protein|nr:tetratricopeptide repeat protein [Deltaproteobacteria bacterium]
MSIGPKIRLWPTLLAMTLLMGCAPKPVWHSLLPPQIEVGQFDGPGGEALTTELKRRESPRPPRGRTQILNGTTFFDYKTTKSQETVLTVTQNVNGRKSTETIPLTVADARLTAKWTLISVRSDGPSQTGQTEEIWQRSYGGYLAQEGLTDATPEEPDKVQELLARSLAALMVTELGPNHTPYNLARAPDDLSREAADLVSQDDWEEAARKWQEILKDNPGYAPALYNMALYHERAGRLAEAWQYYRMAYRSYNDQQHREALTRATDMMYRLGRPPWFRDMFLIHDRYPY